MFFLCDGDHNSNCALNTAPKTAGVVHAAIWCALFVIVEQ